MVPYANAVVQIRTTNASGGGNNRIVTTRTMSDGTYTVSIPAGTYNVCAMATSNTTGETTCSGSSAGVYELQSGFTVNANGTNTLNFMF